MDLILTLTVELDQFIASVQVKIIDFLLSYDGQSCILMDHLIKQISTKNMMLLKEKAFDMV